MSFVTYSQLGKNGRLCNQLFQLSSCIGIAVKNDMFYAFPNWSYQEYFINPLPNSRDFIETHKTPFKTIKEDSFTWEDVKLDNYYNFNILGYRQSPLYWEPHATELIKKYLEPTKIVLDKIYETWYKILSTNITCAVHFRLKDYVEFSDYHTNLQLTDYYKDAIRLMESQNFTDAPTKYIIFSDDIAWCKEYALQLLCNDLHPNNVLFSENFNEVEDLLLGSYCTNQIIANSTFSWWMAYLNENESKVVISPGGVQYPWFGKKSPHDTKDVIPKDWIKL